MVSFKVFVSLFFYTAGICFECFAQNVDSALQILAL